MKVFFPRNIPSWWLAMNIQVWPVSVSIIQLMLLALWVGITLAISNAFIRNWASKMLAFLLAFPFFVIMVIIAFFKYSELTIVQFIAKMIRTHFLDVTKKFQINYLRPDPVSISLAKARKTEHDVVISQKDLILDKEKLERLDVI